MKKYLLPLSFIIIALCFFLSGCESSGLDDRDNYLSPNDNSMPSTIDKSIIKESYFDYSNLKYNPKYTQGKGFALYDLIDFNKINFLFEAEETTLEMYFENKKLLEETKSDFFGFPAFRLMNIGTYTIKINAFSQGVIYNSSFDINVDYCGMPTSINFTFLNSNNQEVDNFVAGETSYIKVNLFSNGKQITDTSCFDFEWSNSNNKSEKLKLDFLSSKSSYKDTQNLKIVCHTNEDSIYTLIASCDFLVKDNISEISARFLNDIPSTIYPNESFEIQAEGIIVFSNGDTEPLALNDIDSEIGICPAIKYYGEQEYSVYSPIFSPKPKNGYYYANNETYSLSIHKPSATICLASFKKENDNYSLCPIQGTEQEIIINQPEHAFIKNVSVSQNEFDFEQLSYNLVSQQVLDNHAELKVFIGNGPGIEYFFFTPYFEGNGLKDYYFTVSNKNIIVKMDVWANKYKLKPLNDTGSCVITLLNPFDNSIMYTFTITFINPTIENTILLKDSTPEKFNSIPNYSNYLSVEQTFYNGNIIVRSLFNTEYIKYKLEGIIYKNEEFSSEKIFTTDLQKELGGFFSFTIYIFDKFDTIVGTVFVSRMTIEP